MSGWSNWSGSVRCTPLRIVAPAEAGPGRRLGVGGPRCGRRRRVAEREPKPDRDHGEQKSQRGHHRGAPGGSRQLLGRANREVGRVVCQRTQRRYDEAADRGGAAAQRRRRRRRRDSEGQQDNEVRDEVGELTRLFEAGGIERESDRIPAEARFGADLRRKDAFALHSARLRPASPYLRTHSCRQGLRPCLGFTG